jgi:hypothetical protein
MSWQVKIPATKSGRESLADVADAAGCHLDGDDRLVTRQAVLVGVEAGVKNARQLEQLFESFDASERRFVIDRLRERAGLKSASEIEREREQYAPRRLPDRRPLRVGIAQSGALVDLNQQEDEAARQATEAEIRRHRHEAKAADAAVEGAQLERDRQADDEAWGIPHNLRTGP